MHGVGRMRELQAIGGGKDGLRRGEVAISTTMTETCEGRLSELRVRGILETALYVEDLARASAFYREAFGFAVLVENERIIALDVSGLSVLLLFRRGATVGGITTPRGIVPSHDGSGPMHFAFSIAKEDLAQWEAHLESCGVVIESRVEWERGGVSIYFRDPDGHSVELVTEGTWATY